MAAFTAWIKCNADVAQFASDISLGGLLGLIPAIRLKTPLIAALQKCERSAYRQRPYKSMSYVNSTLFACLFFYP